MRRTLGTLFKWVGGATAVLSLVFGLLQLKALVWGRRAQRRHVDELLATARLERDARDFAGAWTSDSQAALLAADNPKVRMAQEDLAMAWLEDAHLAQGETFAAFAERLTPILERGLLRAARVRKGDLLAHVGWAEFLRSRDGIADLHPDSLYHQALTADPGNVYAHVMLGHWILWHSGPLDSARAHFAVALAGGRAQSDVRRIQLAALENSHDDAAAEELIRVANEMRVHHEPVDERTRESLAHVYFQRVFSGDAASLHHLLTALPPADQLETSQWLLTKGDDDSTSRPYVLGLLQEAAGSRLDALHTMQRLRAQPGLDPTLRSDVDAAIKRLSKPH